MSKKRPVPSRKHILGLPSNQHPSGETLTKLEVSPSGRMKISRLHGNKSGGGGYMGRSEVFTNRQSQNLMNAIMDRKNCIHAVILHYPPAVREECLNWRCTEPFPLSPNEVSTHIQRLWWNIHRWMSKHVPGERMEYVWVIEWQGKLYPHFHVLLSYPIPVATLRDCWRRAIQATRKDMPFTSRTPWVGYSRKKYTSISGAAKYLSKWMKGEKNPPLYAGFTMDRAWGASRVKGKRVYHSTAERLAPVVRTVNCVSKSNERRCGAKSGRFQTSDRRGATIYVKNPERVLGPHMVLLGHGTVTAKFRVISSIVVTRVVFEKSNDE